MMDPYTHRFRQEFIKTTVIVVVCVVLAMFVAVWRTPDSDSVANVTAIDIEMASWVNGERKWNGVNPIPLDGDLAAQAQLQANRMSQCDCIYHSPRGEMAWWLDGRGWWSVAENVGVSSGAGIHALYGVHLAFIASPPHRNNMLNPAHRGLGLAVRQSPDGRLWIVQFYGGF